MGRASLKLALVPGLRFHFQRISRPYGPGLIEARRARGRFSKTERISRPYGPGLIEAWETRW